MHKKFGKLTVIEWRKGKKTPHIHPMALCKCDCGEERIARSTDIRRGKVVECVKCARITASRKASKTLRKFDPNENAFRRLYGFYKSNAKRKKIQFSLTREECRKLFKSDCFYCGEPPLSVQKTKNDGGSFTYNGIDREDNSIGYISSNVNPCCSTCNYAKREMSTKEFLDWIKRVYSKTK